jgi:RNA polymerase sigma factor (sigma-70 family)
VSPTPSLAYRLLGDERLTRLAEGGSDQAFAAIYGRYGRILHGYCRSLLEDEHDARDAVQNTMLKAFVALRRGGPKGPLRPWLFRIAHNESITIIRQRARQPATLDDSMRAGGADTHRQAEARERLATVLRDLEGLTSHQRGALVMRELGGMGYDEIGVALETSPLAARQAVFAARRALGHVPRAQLRALLPPVPVAAILAAVLGGGGGGGGAAAVGGGSIAVKAIAAAATVSIGFGAVEAVKHAPSPDHADRVVAAAHDPAPAVAKRKAAKAPAVIAAAAVAQPAVVAVKKIVAVKKVAAVVPAVKKQAVVKQEVERRPARREVRNGAEDEDSEAAAEEFVADPVDDFSGRDGARRGHGGGDGDREAHMAREDCPEPRDEDPAVEPAPSPEPPTEASPEPQ